jgi:hypothetical protein
LTPARRRLIPKSPAPRRTDERRKGIYRRVGALRAFTPASRFKLSSGADALSDYQFGKQHLHHLFCKVCGVHSFATGTGPDGVEMRAINVRCLDGVDVAALEVARFDGKSR